MLEIIDAILHALYCVEKVDGDEYRMIFDMVERDQRTVLDSKEKNIVDMVDKAVNETRLQLQILEYKKFCESKEYAAFLEYKKIRNEDWFQELVTAKMK